MNSLNKKSLAYYSLKIGGVTNDSDDEADVTKMDLGKSGKGPLNRFDFDDEEQYGDYMAKREAMPKAAFQYGQKNRGENKTILYDLIYPIKVFSELFFMQIFRKNILRSTKCPQS